LLQAAALSCNSGTICVEMMKKFQSRGCRMIEVPVHHYPRYHGSSQFFRFKHLRKVCSQLIVTWWKLVAVPALRTQSPMQKLEAEARNISSPN